MTPTPHDALFKAGFEIPADAAAVFQRALPSELAAAISWESLERESGSFIDPQLANRHSDLLFRATLQGEPALLYLLVEHQSSNDADMTLRMLVYLVRIFERFRKQAGNELAPLPLIVPVVVAHAAEGWTAPRSFHAMFSPGPATIPGLAELVPSFSMRVLDLNALSNDEIAALSMAAFPKLVLWALRDARRKNRLLQNFEQWRGAFSEAMRTPQGKAAVEQVLTYFQEVVDELYLEELRAKIQGIPGAEELTMTIAEQMRAEGRAEGREQGQRELLRNLLAQKFGKIPEHLTQRIEAASLDDLSRYAMLVLTAVTIEAVFA